MIKLYRVVAVLAAAGAVACGGSATPTSQATSGTSGPVTLEFWDTNAGPTRTPYWQELIRRFEAANPTITVNYVGIPIAQQQQKEQTAVQTGVGPDVSNEGSNYIASLSALNGLVPLDSQYNSWSEKNDIPASVISALKSLGVDGKLYGLPISTNITTLYYRRDLLTQKGLPAPTNWTNFYNDVNGINNPSAGIYGFGLRGGVGSIAQLEPWIIAQAGFTTYFDKNGKSVFSSPASVSVLEKVASLYGKQTAKDDINHGYTEMVAEFDGGHDGFIMHNLGSYPQHVQAFGKDNVGAVVLPAMSNGKRYLAGGASNAIAASVFKTSKHPTEAWKFVAFLASADSQSYINQSIGQMPVNTKVSSAAWVKDNTAIQSALAAFADKNTVIINPPIFLPDYASLQSQEEPNFQKVLLGQMSAQDFLTDYSNKLNQSLASYNQAHHK